MTTLACLWALRWWITFAVAATAGALYVERQEAQR